MDPQKQSNEPIVQQAQLKTNNNVVIIIVLAILAVGGFIFGGVEFWQNMQKDDEIKNLQAKIIKIEEQDKDTMVEENKDQEELNNGQNCNNLPSEKNEPIPVSFDDKTIALINEIYSEFDYGLKFLQKGKDGISEIMAINVPYQQNKKTGGSGGSYLAFYYRVKQGDDWALVHKGNAPDYCSNFDENILEAFGDLLSCVK
jgi:hypothetical protein